MQKELLDKYKNYDYLNEDRECPFVKILVSYIKPSFLFKSEILTPIHVGRTVENNISIDGCITPENLNWLHKNCEFCDNDFKGNISEVNRRVGFLTGTYWAWKNYEKLNNPKYIGSFGYRRLLNPEFLDDLNAYDVILPNKFDFKIASLKKQIEMFHSKVILDMLLQGFNNIYPHDMDKLDEYLNQTKGYFNELYVFKKEIFFRFCDWIFPLLFEYLKYPSIKIDNEIRDVAFCMERLTGYFCNELTKNNKIKIHHTNMIFIDENSKNGIKINPKLLKILRENIKNA